MASTSKNAGDELQGQVLDTIRKGQEAVIEGLRSWAEAAEQFVPRTAAFPGSERLPTPHEVVDATYDFAVELLKAQREFLHKAIQATAPLYDRIEEETVKATGQVEEQGAKATGRAKS